jgi:hypothetical protein
MEVYFTAKPPLIASGEGYKFSIWLMTCKGALGRRSRPGNLLFTITDAFSAGITLPDRHGPGAQPLFNLVTAQAAVRYTHVQFVELIFGGLKADAVDLKENFSHHRRDTLVPVDEGVRLSQVVRVSRCATNRVGRGVEMPVLGRDQCRLQGTFVTESMAAAEGVDRAGVQLDNLVFANKDQRLTDCPSLSTHHARRRLPPAS